MLLRTRNIIVNIQFFIHTSQYFYHFFVAAAFALGQEFNCAIDGWVAPKASLWAATRTPAPAFKTPLNGCTRAPSTTKFCAAAHWDAFSNCCCTVKPGRVRAPALLEEDALEGFAFV
jgi:hypothetical protein